MAVKLFFTRGGGDAEEAIAKKAVRTDLQLKMHLEDIADA
jgi:hypothetical protein